MSSTSNYICFLMEPLSKIFKTLLLTVFTLFYMSVFSQSIDSCDDFVDGPNSNWTHVLVATTIDDGAASQDAQTFNMNVTSLPENGASFRVYKTTANGSDFIGNPVALTLGSNSFTVGAVAFDRAVKFQFSNGFVEFDELSLNGTDSDCINPLTPPNSSIISDCDDFVSGPNAWPYVLIATTLADGSASQAAQTFSMNITSLPADGANVRVYKTTANGNDFFGNPVALTLGYNTITVDGVGFNRAVKFQFSIGSVEFDELSLNGEESDCAVAVPPAFSLVSDCIDFIAGPSAWPYVLVATTISDGAASQVAQTYSMNITSLPADGANVRVYKTTANGNDFFANPLALTIGTNSITVAGVSFNRAVKFQFSSGAIVFDALSLNGEDSDCVLAQEITIITGCTDSLALNFDSFANTDDGTCEFEEIENPCYITPTGLYVDNIIHNRIRFNWSQTEASPSHYMIRYREVGINNWTVIAAGPQTPLPFNGTSRTRYFMEPETTYEWNIRARVLNEDGSINCQSDWSETFTYTTLPACANLENLSVSTEATWVTFFADAPDESWGVWQSKGKIREVGLNNYRYVNSDNIGNINGLKGNFTANTDYEWHTKAWCAGNVDENGNSDPQYHSGWGEFSAFTTEELCDKLPINLSTSTNSANTAVIMSWDSPISGNPDHYFLEMTNNTSGAVYQWNNIAGTDNSKTKFNQSPGDEISWRIRGACGTNGTSWATIFTQPTFLNLGGEKLHSLSLNSLEIYPNPSRGVFNITFNSEEVQRMTVMVVNMIGEEIFTKELTEFVGQYTQVIDMNTDPKGVYFLEITTSTGGVNKKIVLQ